MKAMIRSSLVLLALATGATAMAAEFQYAYDSQNPPVVPLQTSATTGNGDTVNLRHLNKMATVTLDWSTGITGGAITIEVAKTCSYAGTWAPWKIVAYSDSGGVLPRQDIIGINQSVGCVRTRISTNITNGTISTSLSAVR